MGKIKPNFRERAMFLVRPEAGEKAFRERVQRETQKKTGDIRQTAGGYGNHGASTTLNSMIGWIVNGGAAEDDIDLQGSTLRQRARDLYAGGGLAKSGTATLTTSVVGWGIQPKPKLDAEKLGLSDEAAAEWEANTLREFRLWAETTMCDAERTKNFAAMQELAFRSQLMSGDAFVLFEMKENGRTPYQTALRILEADRVSTPDSGGESESEDTDSGGRIVDGVEITKDGEVVRYYIANRHPLAESTSTTLEWTSIDAYGKDTGCPNILHITTFERPEQRRGIPFVSSEIETIKQLSRYINSELAANVVCSMLTAFLTSDADDGKIGMEDAVNEDEKVTDDDYKIELAPGAVYDLPPGKDIKSINPTRNNTGFEAFVNTLMMMVGASMEIPKEVLLKKYDSNYTAARSALLDFWRTVKIYRNRFISSFCKPVYETWLAEAVSIGRVDAPGFFDDPAIRQAWCGCVWMGASMGHVDPLKEVNAAEKRIDLNITTQEQEAAEYNGNDWNANVRQRRKETAALNQQEAENGTEEKEDKGK